MSNRPHVDRTPRYLLVAGRGKSKRFATGTIFRFRGLRGEYVLVGRKHATKKAVVEHVATGAQWDFGRISGKTNLETCTVLYEPDSPS